MKEAVKEEIENVESYDENEHVINMENFQSLDFNINENYKYIEDNKLFEIFSYLLYYGIAVPVLYVLTKIVYDLKIEGKENIQKVDAGAVSISNHVLILDCAMVGLAWGDKKVYYTALEDSFKIPFVRKLIKLLRAIPIPKEAKNKPHFMKVLDDALKNGNIIHFYPEAALWPYCDKMRKFKTGAFHFAVRNDVPILPMVFTFREPTGFRKFLKKKKDVTLTILPPAKGDKSVQDIKTRIELLKADVHSTMENIILSKKE